MSEFKLIVAGGRDFADRDLMLQHLQEIGRDHPGLTIVSGMARGADKLAYDLAKEFGVKVYEFPADWDQYGKGAGFRRNTEMAAFADALLAYWDGTSRGTKHMINTMANIPKPVHIIRY